MNYVEEIEKILESMEHSHDQLIGAGFCLESGYVADEWGALNKALKKIKRIQKRSDILLGAFFSERTVKNEFAKRVGEVPSNARKN